MVGVEYCAVNGKFGDQTKISEVKMPERILLLITGVKGPPRVLVPYTTNPWDYV